jgi:hypothetical protein
LQKNLFPPDSVKIHYRHLVAATQAFVYLKYYRKESGLCQERLHNKDIVIQFYERGYNKCKQQDSINELIITNKTAQLNTAFNLYQQEKKERKKKQAATIGLAVITPVVAVLSFILGFYIHR